jgi:hypothetical protein
MRRNDIVRQLLLNLAVEGPIRVLNISASSPNGTADTKEVPGHCAAEYSNEVLSLLKAGMITISSDHTDDDVQFACCNRGHSRTARQDTEGARRSEEIENAVGRFDICQP